MGTKRVSVESCKSGLDRVDIIVVAWDKRKEGKKTVEFPLGEKGLSFPGGTKPRDMLDSIREAGEQIEEAATQAKEIRTEINQLLSEEVPK